MNHCNGEFAIGLAYFLHLCLEDWLGRTDKVKANSTFELIENVARFIFKNIKR